MKDKDLLKLLLQNGWKDVRQRGSHHRLKKDDQVEVIAVHCSFTIRTTSAYYSTIPENISFSL